MKRRHGARLWSMAVVIGLLIVGISGSAFAQENPGSKKPGEVEGHWEITLNVVESVPVGDQTSEEAPEGPGPPVGVTFQTRWRAVVETSVSHGSGALQSPGTVI